MKKFLMAALALLTSVLGVQAQGYQDYRDHNYGSRRDFMTAQWKLASLYRRCVKKELLD